MNEIDSEDQFGRPEFSRVMGWITPLLATAIGGSVWPPPSGSGTPPFDNPIDVLQNCAPAPEAGVGRQQDGAVDGEPDSLLRPMVAMCVSAPRRPSGA